MSESEFSSLLPEQLKRLACASPFPLYAVGGSVRDYLFGGKVPPSPDWDICAPVSLDLFLTEAEKSSFAVKSVYKHTGTVKLTDQDGIGYEFSCFRSDKYVRGEHAPREVFFTNDIELDARRRDFTCNAVYFDVKQEAFVDPLNGRSAIKERRLSTVKDANVVFGEDGLRLMRLARFTAQLCFLPDDECRLGATKNARLVRDVHPQRILTELRLLLTADKKSSVPYSHYDGLKILDETNVLDYILPELAEGRSLNQRADFHRYDVLEHSLRCAKYADCDETLRFAALLHDVGKVPCLKETGNCHSHEQASALIAADVLSRLGLSARQSEKIVRLIGEHMYDMDGKTRPNKLRRYLVKNYDIVEDLLKLKQADYSACKDDPSPAPTCVRWRTILSQMKEEKVPFSLRELSVNGRDLIAAGAPKEFVSIILDELLADCSIEPKLNKKETLLRRALALAKSLTKS